jgi:hypothetical protein
MSTRFRSDGTRTGWHTAGDDTIVEVYPSSSTAKHGAGFSTIDGATYDALVVSEPDPFFWKVSGGILSEMTGPEKTEATANFLTAEKTKTKTAVGRWAAVVKQIANMASYTDANVDTAKAVMDATVDAQPTLAVLLALGYGDAELGQLETTLTELGAGVGTYVFGRQVPIVSVSAGVSTTTSSTPSTKVSIVLPAVNADFLVTYSAVMSNDSTLGSAGIDMYDLTNAVVLNTEDPSIEPNDVTNDYSGVITARLTQTVGGGARTIEGRYYQVATGTASFSDAVLSAVRVS